jgi:hypothetical protein
MKLKTLVLLVVGVVVGTFMWLDAPPALAQILVNDFFNSPLVVGSIPYSQDVDTSAATMEPGEPLSFCSFNSSGGTVWFAYTPTADESVVARGFGPDSVVAAYTGSSVDTLNMLGCGFIGFDPVPLPLNLTGGTTYYFQIAPLFSGGLTTFTLDPPPPLEVGFDYFPSDPSSFDTISFNAFVFGGSEFPDRFRWDFGDGQTAQGQFVNHRFTADGDYRVRLTARTAGGERATAEQTISVRTHDVAITKIVAPKAGRVRRTRQILITVKTTRYDEMVRVELYRSVPGGEVLIGFQDQMVYLKKGNRGTEFPFNYTFTEDDAVQGKVSFRAQAITQGRDAIPADNTAISSPPTKVRVNAAQASIAGGEAATDAVIFLPVLVGND